MPEGPCGEPCGVELRGGVAGRCCGEPCGVELRGGIAGSHAGWYCGEPCVVGRRDVMGGGPFYLAATGAFMRVSLQRFPSLPLEIRNHSSRGAVLEGFLAAIPKSGPEIKNHCSIWADSEENLASIPKSGPEIKNHCSIWADSEENLASIPKSGPEIKNHCSRGLVAVCRRNHSSLPQRRLESDADIVAATTAADGTILLCGNEE